MLLGSMGIRLLYIGYTLLYPGVQNVKGKSFKSDAYIFC